MIGTKINNGTLAVGPTPTSNATTPLSTGLVTLNGGTLALQGQLASSYHPGLINNYYIAGSNGVPAPVNNNGNNGWTAIQDVPTITSTFGSLTPQYSVPSSTNTGGPAITTFFYGGSNNTALNNFSTNSTGGGNTNGDPLKGDGTNNGSNFTVISTGYINIPSTGQYTFATSSDDGSMMFINVGGTWQTVASNNFFQGVVQRSNGAISLTQGVYPIEIAYYEGGGGYFMSAKEWRETAAYSAVRPIQGRKTFNSQPIHLCWAWNTAPRF